MKETLLERIRKAKTAPKPLPAYPVRPSRDPEEVLERFVEHVADYRATVLQVASEADIPSTIKLLLKGENRVVVPADLPQSWLPEGISLLRDHAGVGHTTLKDQQAVVTGCKLGISDTGTIVLDSGPKQGRRAISLIPDHHICIVLAHQVVQGVHDAVKGLEDSIQNKQPVTWISGPSATSDIELVRVEGVHGPRTLDVIVVESKEPT